MVREETFVEDEENPLDTGEEASDTGSPSGKYDPDPHPAATDGCGCNSATSPSGVAAWLLGLLAIGLVRRPKDSARSSL